MGERFADLPYRIYPDLLPGTGVIGAIVTALEATPADRVLAVGCDMPSLEPRLLTRLLTLAATADGALRPADLGARLDIREITLEELRTYGDPARLLANLNSPDDLARYESIE